MYWRSHTKAFRPAVNVLDYYTLHREKAQAVCEIQWPPSYKGWPLVRGISDTIIQGLFSEIVAL